MAQRKKITQKKAAAKKIVIDLSRRKKGVQFVVSGCLIGKNCYFDGTHRQNPTIKHLQEKGIVAAVCPEQLGGLKTPRPAAEIFAGTGKDVLNGRAYVFNKEGQDVSKQFVRGALEFLRIAKEYGVKSVILKARSPSCGLGHIYDGNFTKTLKIGNGVTAELLLRNHIEVITDEMFEKKYNVGTKKTKKQKKR